jgi:hypothetical protein
VEPAHPVLVEYHDQLRALYQFIREAYQPEIDAMFDRVSREIGFVVTTTAPVTMNVADGRIKRVGISEKSPLAGTIFEKGLAKVFRAMSAGEVPLKKAGTYEFYLIWHDALKLKLRMDWVEPAHYPFARRLEPYRLSQRRLVDRQQIDVVWESHEPAHWFDPGVAIEAEEAVVISVIDEVYPELRLIDRLMTFRKFDRRVVPPEVQEPAHFRIPEDLRTLATGDVLAELAEVLRRYGY